MAQILKWRCSQEVGPVQAPRLYDCVPEGELAAEVLRRSSPFAFPIDRVLFREGEAPNGIFLVRNGSVTLTLLSGGQVVMCARAEAGSLIGLPSTVSEKPYSMTAKATHGAEIRRLSPEGFRELMKTHPGLSIEVIRILAGEVRAVRQTLK
jgi:CRP/FNR family transcriptional regulator, cyclic AMP receptor protein